MGSLSPYGMVVRSIDFGVPVPQPAISEARFPHL